VLSLPDFPWDELASAKASASAHPEGLIDLSVGSPVDDTPALLQDALATASNAHHYPTVRGSADTRADLVAWWQQVRGARAVTADGVIPTIGSKEMVGLLPLLLGLGPGDTVVTPAIAYPTYEVGAALVGATVLASDDPAQWPASTKLVWLNSPSNPTGVVATVAVLQAAIARGRELGAVVASDECYALLGSKAQPSSPSLLSDEVTGGNISGLLALYSLSKQSSVAGYRAAMLAGDPRVMDPLVLARRHLGLIAPEPIQQALRVALGDAGHVEQIRETYQQRRERLQPAVEAAGLTVTGGDAGLYLWATAKKPAMQTVEHLASRGILVAPGHFYGQAGAQHVRIALTASDIDIDAAVARLAG
jgi:succinyldiaminopimelate transaminase